MALRLVARLAKGNASRWHCPAAIRALSSAASFPGDLSRNLQSAPVETLQSRPDGQQQLPTMTGAENAAALRQFASDEDVIGHVTGILMNTQQWRELDGKLANLGDQIKAQHVPEILKRAHTSDVVFNFFDWARARKRLQLDAPTFQLMFAILNSREQPEEMQWLLGEMRGSGIKLDNAMFVTVMQSFARMRRVPDACRLFWKMEGLECSPEIAAYNAILKILMDAGNSHDFDMIYSSLKFSSTALDGTTYEIMFERACRAGKADEAYRLFEQMKMKFTPPLRAYSLLCECLSKSGKDQLAKDIWENRPR